MTTISEYNVEQMGIILPAACIEITEVNSNSQEIYHNYNMTPGTTPASEPAVMKNTIVRFKVWADEQAYIDKKTPVTQGEKMIKLNTSQVKSIATMAMALAFPESTTK